MSYTVHILNTKTKMVKEFFEHIAWQDHHYFMWEEGNWSCDCNRGLMFDGEDYECGDDLFEVVKIVNEDGSIIKLDSK
tara:strand:- start:353 stop:586 length:234 start_codon:yes stop_codon:yes gene_type:complete